MAPLNRDMGAVTRQSEFARGFPPVVGVAPQVLVLGSLPGRASIAAGQYYAMPRNAFWSVMADLCGAGPELDYAARLDRLTAAGIALWDVLHAAERPGSLDAAIVTASEQANDIAALIRRHRSIRVIAFNGKTAAVLFRRHIAPVLARDDLSFVSLPSTSPAHAAMNRETKIRHWRRGLMPHLRAG